MYKNKLVSMFCLVALLAACNTYKPMETFEEAVNNSDSKAVAYYLKHGENANQKNEVGSPMLLLAALQQDSTIVEQLLKAGADVNTPAPDGTTPLLGASAMGYIKNVELLLQAGADVNKANEEGVTPLIAASGDGFPEVVKLLLAAHADLNAKTSWGLSAIQVAIVEKHLDDILPLLKEAKAAAKENAQ